MLEKADALLKLALAIAALAIGLSVGYYYAIFLPNEALQEKQFVLNEAQQQQKMESQKIAALERAKKIAQEKYDQCLFSAFQSYTDRWESTCRRLNKDDTERKNQCLQNGYSEQYCGQISVTPSKNCSLNNTLADDYDASHSEAKKLCLEEFKASSS